MLKHVLIPLDGSKLAEEALEYALNIVEPNGKITLVSAIEVPEMSAYGYYPAAIVPDNEDTKEKMLPFVKHYLNGVGEKLQEQGYTVRLETVVGDPAEVITETAEKFKVDVIVMSTHGRSGLSRWLFGSVTSKVLSAKPCPVYVIPSK